MRQRLVIQGRTITLNEYIAAERSNRFKAAKIKKDETERVYWECKRQKLHPVPRIDEITFLYYHDSVRVDFDNAESYQKFIWDGLVVAKILPDDTQKYTPTQRTHIHCIDRSNPRIEIDFITTEKTVSNDSVPSL